MTIILTVTLFVKSISVIYMEDLKNPVYRTRESTDVSFHCCCLSAPWLSALSEMKVKASRTVFAIPWTAVCSAPLFMEYSRQEYWSGLPFPSLGDLPDWGIKPRSPTLQADSSPASHKGSPYLKWRHHFPSAVSTFCPQFLHGRLWLIPRLLLDQKWQNVSVGSQIPWANLFFLQRRAHRFAVGKCNWPKVTQMVNGKAISNKPSVFLF